MASRLRAVRDPVTEIPLICGALSDDADRSVREAIVEAVAEPVQAQLGFYAVGGWGRREFFPHADIDLLVLYDGPDGEAADAAERLESAVPGARAALQALALEIRRRKLRLAMRVRSLREQRRWMATEITVAAAALDIRQVAGNAALVRDVVQTARGVIAEAFPGGVPAFVGRLREEIMARHDAVHDAGALLEPDLKTGRGSLRDGHAVRWAARAMHGSVDPRELAGRGILSQTEADEYARAYWFFAHVRLALHAVSRFKLDRLVFERQAPVARLMGFVRGDDRDAVTAFMQLFYGNADLLANLADRWLLDWASEGDSCAQPMGGPWALRAGHLTYLDSARVPRDLRDVRDICRMAHQLRVPIHPSVRRMFRELAAGLPARAGREPVATDLLRLAILDAADFDHLLDALFDAGLFRRLVPEWSHLVGLTAHDVYHVFTTDRHLLQCWRAVATIHPQSPKTPRFVTEAWKNLDETQGRELTDAVLLATLLHDVGKGLDGDHSMVGAGMAAEIAHRLGMSAAQARLVRWLVLEHLVLARTSQRRDPTDPAVHAACSESINSTLELDALTVVTWADMTSVAPNADATWKLSLLQSLHEGIRSVLSGDASRVRSPREIYTEACAEAGNEVSRRAIDLIELFAPAALRGLSGAELIDVVEALGARDPDRHDAHALVMRPGAAPERVRATVAMRDSRALLARLAAAATAAGYDILSARILTTRNGLAVDQFELRVRAQTPRASAGAQMRFSDLVERIATDRIALDELRAQHRSESRMALPGRPDVPTVVSVHPADHDASIAIVEIKTRDRAGLLAQIAGEFSRFDVSIERALIHVEGDRAIDVFYARGEAVEPLVASLREHL